MQVKGSLLKTRWEFLSERFGPEAVQRVLALLPEAEHLRAGSALSGAWIPFSLATQVDEAIVSCFGGHIGICMDIGAYSARRNLTTIYRIFLDRSKRDPFRLLEHLAVLHGSLYDWGSSRASRLDDGGCLMEADYAGGATRVNCLTALGFYREALLLVGIETATATERGCEASGARRCAIELRWGG